MILELKFSFFQPANLKLLLTDVSQQHIDCGIKVAVFNFKFYNATLYLFAIAHHGPEMEKRKMQERPFIRCLFLTSAV